MSDYPVIPALNVQIAEHESLLKALAVINGNDARIALVIDPAGKMRGSVTDGDIRRAVLAGLTLESPVREAMHTKAFVMPAVCTRAQVLSGMQAAQIKQMPLLQEDGTLAGIAVYDMLTGFARRKRNNPVVIMAGGKGKRLWPLTRDVPKPMVEVGGKPMLEHIIGQFVRQGFSDITISLNYLGHVIEEYFADGTMFDCRITYMREDAPLGTAGALSLIEREFSQPFVLMNGDILSSVDFGELVDFHTTSGAKATVCARIHRTEIPFGVIEMEHGYLSGITEKPVYEHFISAGMYVLDSSVLKSIPKNIQVDMPTVLQTLASEGEKIAVFPLRDEWTDVGRLDDFVSVSKRMAEGR